jgi:alpha-L-fucosidase
MGKWLKVNGEAIYGTRHAGRECQWTEGERPRQGYKEFQQEYNLMAQVGQLPRNGKAVKQVFFTKKANALYAITVGWPGSSLVLRNITVSPESRVSLLGIPGELKHELRGKDLEIHVPALNGDQVPCQHAYTFKITGAVLPPE